MRNQLQINWSSNIIWLVILAKSVALVLKCATICNLTKQQTQASSDIRQSCLTHASRSLSSDDTDWFESGYSD